MFVTSAESTHRAYQLTIANNAALSSVLDTANIAVGGVLLPATWTTANLTVQGSIDGTNFFNITDQYGAEVVITAAASTISLLSLGDMWAVQYLRFRSGTSVTPVNQGGARILTILCR